MKNLKTFDSNYFIGKSHFEEDCTQNYLVFQPMHRYLKVIAGVSNYIVTPFLDYSGCKIRAEFNGICLIMYTHGKIINIYIVYEISKSINISDYPMLEN